MYSTVTFEASHTYTCVHMYQVCMHTCTSENAECISTCISNKINVVNAKIGQYLLYIPGTVGGTS